MKKILIVSATLKSNYKLGEQLKGLLEKFDAVKLVQTGSKVVGGKGGGGRPDMAQAGGPDVSKIEESLRAIEEVIFEQD